jgi:hypothetical protein
MTAIGVSVVLARHPHCVQPPRSELLRCVLGSLRDHPHHDTPDEVTQLLAWLDLDVVSAALVSLEGDRLVSCAGGHWQLTWKGWGVARADDPYQDGD